MGFEVVTKDLIMDVVATYFNVTSRDEKTAVFMDEGEVHLNLRKEKDLLEKQIEAEGPEKRKKDDKSIMHAGEAVRYSIRTQELERATGDLYGKASWPKGTAGFSEAPVAKGVGSWEGLDGR